MDTDYKAEALQNLVKAKLNTEKVKLWLPPHTAADGQKGEVPQDLISRYSLELERSADDISVALESLRCHAVEKLAARNQFQQSGVASLKVKLAGNIQHTNQERGHNLNMEVNLGIRGEELKVKVAEAAGIEVHYIKLICSGRVVEDNKTLQEQNIKNLSQLMALCLSQTEAEAQRRDKEVSKVARTREAAEILSSKVDGGDDDNANYYLQIADQNGKIIDLPKEERKALALAMTMHEKGKAALKKKNYGEALLLFLEADKEFKQCRSSILEAVDNYAILCLDIVWCHLCLKNVDQLPDADNRLQTCDDCFRKSYGPNLERLALVRGGTGMERALFMRLHLLQGILAFHTHHQQNARQLLNRAEQELKLLSVDEEAMTQVMAMGFTQHEARLGLRVCEGNVQLAVAHIMKRREEKEELRKTEREEKRQKKIQRKLGKTAKGDWVNVRLYDQLISMGFPKGASAEALRQSNNDVTSSISILQEHPELLNLPDPEKEKVTITDDMLSQLVSLGFEPEAARAALSMFSGDVQTAVEELLKNTGSIPQSWIDAVEASSSSSSSRTTSSSSGGSGSSSDDSDDSDGNDVFSDANDSPTKSPEELKQEKEAIASIIPDLPQEEDSHLDLTLEEEAQFLHQYKALMESL